MPAVVAPRAVIFDLGGVIVELGPLSDILGDATSGDEEFWAKWLHSAVVRDFEGGFCSTDDFGERMVAEFDLPFSGAEMIDRFRAWPKGLFAGAAELLTELHASNGIVVGALSNSNPIHWYEQQDAETIRSLFDSPFLSYEMKMIKPDPEIYHHVASSLLLEPRQILYFDDNRINVDGARAAGWDAHVAKGPADCRRHLAGIDLVSL